MPRKPRIEANDAIYHVINRGNYRAFVFETEGARKAFKSLLFDTCERFSWRLSAFCVMGNHFHLCLGTPLGNLSSGMKWLQGTYATRFNRFRKESGHLFQGRFKSLLVEPGRHWSELVAYIHLNPVRAGLCEFETLGKYPWTSLELYPKIKNRPDFFDATWMDYEEGLSDNHGGWRRYGAFLKMRATRDQKEIEALDRKMCRGWCIGSPKYRKEIAKETLGRPESIRMDRDQLSQANQEIWESALSACLEAIGKTDRDAESDRYSARWKLAIACRMKKDTSVSNKWLSEKLSMGIARGVSSNCSIYQRDKQKYCEYYAKLPGFTFAT